MSDFFSTLHNITFGRRINRKSPGVYAAWLGNQALYIGCSKHVANRIKERDLFHENRIKAFSECDVIEIYPCDSLTQAQQLEWELIELYQPRYNIVGRYLHREPRPSLPDGVILRIPKGCDPTAHFSFKQLQKQHAKLFGAA